MGITGITQEKLAKMQKKSVLSMPNNPSERGMSPSAIKSTMVAPLFDKENSIVSEINRIVEEINQPELLANYSHTALKNLDFENSGHTGFASAKQLEDVSNRVESVSSQVNEQKLELFNLQMQVKTNTNNINYIEEDMESINIVSSQFIQDLFK